RAVKRVGLRQRIGPAGDRAGAIGTLRRAIAARPSVEARAALAAYLARAGGSDALAEADALYRALLTEAGPVPALQVNHANVLKLRGDLAGAERLLTRALKRAPETPGARANLAAIHYEQGDWPKAERAFARAVEADGADVLARRGLGQMLLGRGTWAKGWEFYEARLRQPGAEPKAAVPASVAPWSLAEARAADLSTARLLLWREQGLGEQILFSALIPDLMARTEALGLLAEPRLAALFARSFPGLEVIADDRADAPARAAGYTARLALCSLGGVLRAEAASFRAPTPFLHPDPARVAAFAAWLATLPPGRRIGVSWRSEKTRAAGKKSIPLAEWGPVLSRPGHVFVSLQYGETAEELAEARAAGHVIHTAPDLDPTEDIDGLAALIAALDGVVSISNVTAHLAGAVGTPQTLLLAPSHFWYWGYRGEETGRFYPEQRRRDGP
ncbi:MAG: tetratricopeptide repeat protein, partial [Pseudomonadota bacterium]